MRAKPTTHFLGELLREVRDGRLAPAAFQRPYVWSKADVEAFWASIMEDLPIGSFLVWSPAQGTDVSRMGRARIGPVVSEGGDRSFVLDGQNRLATYAWSMRAPGDPMPEGLSEAERETWGSDEYLVADARDRTIRFRPEADLDAYCFSPAVLVDPGFLGEVRRRMATGVEFDDGHFDFFDDVQRHVRECRCSTTVLEDATPAQALEAFRRVCRAGVPMTDADFEAALSFALPPVPQEEEAASFSP